MPPAPARPTGQRAHRLTGQGAFEAVFRIGRRVEGLHLSLVVAPSAVPGGRTGYVIGRKVSVRAVDRNRLRRKLREVMRAQRPSLPDLDVIVRVKRAKGRAEQDAATAEAARLLASLGRQP